MLSSLQCSLSTPSEDNFLNPWLFEVKIWPLGADDKYFDFEKGQGRS